MTEFAQTFSPAMDFTSKVLAQLFGAERVHCEKCTLTETPSHIMHDLKQCSIYINGAITSNKTNAEYTVSLTVFLKTEATQDAWKVTRAKVSIRAHNKQSHPQADTEIRRVEGDSSWIVYHTEAGKELFQLDDAQNQTEISVP